VIDEGPVNVLGVRVHAVDYESATAKVIDAASEHRAFGVSALAVHGVMCGVDDDEHRWRLNHLSLVTPDGQPVRWAMRWLHGVRLPDRVYGPELMRRVLEQAERTGHSVFLFGTTPEILDALTAELADRYPELVIAGVEPSRFRRLEPTEQRELVDRIGSSGADIVFVGLGCPRQEVFVSEMVEELSVPTLAVGAAFEYLAGLKKEPPAWVQRFGLQWLHRLVRNPLRLAHRYLVLNPRFVVGVARQRMGQSRRWDEAGRRPTEPVRYG
jgi:N-acetylglucosaminyldiphosphoundecaprenol N-acetyl-beta-D-mannosaminyltransferase